MGYTTDKAQCQHGRRRQEWVESDQIFHLVSVHSGRHYLGHAWADDFYAVEAWQSCWRLLAWCRPVRVFRWGYMPALAWRFLCFATYRAAMLWRDWVLWKMVAGQGTSPRMHWNKCGAEPMVSPRTFSDPRFLWLALVLGMACSLVYLATGEIGLLCQQFSLIRLDSVSQVLVYELFGR